MAAFAWMLPALCAVAAGTAALDGGCNCEAACAQLVAGLKQKISELQAEVSRLLGGPARAHSEEAGKDLARAASGQAAERHSADADQAFPCGAHWELNSNAEVAAKFGCSAVGELQVGFGVTSLSGLWFLTTAGNITIFGNNNLESLTGLEGLTTVEGDLKIWGNRWLTSLTGLGNLERVGNTLSVGYLPELPSLSGLGSLASAGHMELFHNALITSLAGLEKLKQVGVLRISFNEQLTSLSGFSRLSRVTTLDIFSNPRLTSIAGLRSLQTIEEALSLRNHSRLESLMGLERITTLGELWVEKNWFMKLTGLENLASVTRQVTVMENWLVSLAPLGHLKTAGEIQILDEPLIHSLAQLESLETVHGELRIERIGRISSLDIRNLKYAGGLLLRELHHFKSLDVQGLAPAWVSIIRCSLRSLEGLALDGAVRLLVQSPLERMEYLGGPFAKGASVRLVQIDDDAWPACITPHERGALVAAVSNMNDSHIPSNVTSVPDAAADPDTTCRPQVFGTLSCTKGLPCSLSLPGEESIFISGRFTGCGACSEGQLRYDVVQGEVHLGEGLRDEEAGLRSICRCGGDRGGPVAQLLLQGPRQSSVTVCVRGQNCVFKVDGEELERAGRMVLRSNCGRRDPSWTLVASPSTKNVFLLGDLAAWYTAPPSRYKLCWTPCTATTDGNTCPAPEDNYFRVSQVDLLGAYSRSYTRVLGDDLSVPNIGLGVSESDRMRLLRVCGEANEEGIDALEASSSAFVFSFGVLTAERVRARTYRLCWCQVRDGMECNSDEDFTADSGEVEILCPRGQEPTGSNHCVECASGRQKLVAGLESCLECAAGQYSQVGKDCESCPAGTVAALTGSSVCTSCEPWESVDDGATGCSADPAEILLLTSFLLSMGAFCMISVLSIRRRLSVVDVSLDQCQTFITTFGPHGFSNFGRSSFPVALRKTGHPGLDRPREPLRVRVVDAMRLELLTQGGRSIQSRLDTSKGTLVVAFPHDLYHQRRPVPPLISLPVLLSTTAVLGYLVSGSGMVQEGALGATAVAVACTLVMVAARFWPHATPLAKRLSQFRAKLMKRNPNPESCAKGPDRALSVGKLHELLEFFRDLIRDRSAYYMDQCILLPLTKPKKLSYAELVGAGQVEWFVSHFWGTAFEHFCVALQKHAEVVCGNRRWTELKYWVCFCSNNQHFIAEELGSGWEESSFFLTLKSGLCQGTCMVLDDKALPLTRIWCIFELLQTVKLQHHQESFQGLLLCTSGGVLNTGNGSVEVATALARRVAEMDLEKAQATSAKDADMIRRQVVQEMGSFDALNHFVADEVRKMLLQAQLQSNQQFTAVLALLDEHLASNEQSTASV